MYKNLFWNFPGSPVAKIHTPDARGLDWIPGWGTRAHMLQLRICMHQ